MKVEVLTETCYLVTLEYDGGTYAIVKSIEGPWLVIDKEAKLHFTADTAEECRKELLAYEEIMANGV